MLFTDFGPLQRNMDRRLAERKTLSFHPPPPAGRDYIAYPWKPAGASGVATRQLRRHSLPLRLLLLLYIYTYIQTHYTYTEIGLVCRVLYMYICRSVPGVYYSLLYPLPRRAIPATITSTIGRRRYI